VRKYKNEHPGFTALIKEIDWWKKWHKNTILPPNISKEEVSVYSQSVAILKMAQCRERFPARGQIVNSFPPQKKIMSAPLSMGFVIDAFLNSGHHDEALSALQFIMNGRCGSYKHFQWAGEDIGVGQNYCISTDHYFGNGLEANSAGEFGPRLYLGNFGVVLWNLKQYVEITNDVKFLEYYWPKISTEIADVIINSIDNTGLIRADNGFFNRGAPKHYKP
jgi:GH15 family glucan-1,4-alpha-glucosidase